ncbi:glycosyltransferase family 2 protein [Imperialibacter roseus]|uniref:Glycosyltransferase family 2 protein n=1 Tax=Imperialibacter roseus TaxID=1324217 RepID=A0ABZ0IP97_9BACT|nr:glycosyltransferase family 2 protein [Imperialibacter roseus]WOK06278.1 glycosyltransferase family 2 protein [Imperialibacter roseus]
MTISIITVVYNNRQFIEGCINSVIGQEHKGVEYIIVDGGSTDGTLEIINKYASKITSFISEPDQGIYDAMNKGIGLATGEVVGILNADDFYVNHDVLSKVASTFISDSGIDALYADVEYVRRDNPNRVVRKWHSGAYKRERFYYGWSPPHPTFFVRKEVFQKHGHYNTDLKIAADYEMMLRVLFVNQVRCAYLPEVIIKMRDGGVSNKSIKNRIQANREDGIAWKINNVTPRRYTLGMKPLRKVGQFF